MKRTIIDASQMELEEKVVTIKRVTKVVKGGRNMRFTMLAPAWGKPLRSRRRSAKAKKTQLRN